MLVEGHEDPFCVYREILTTVGGYQDVLRRFDPITDPVEYKTHTLKSKDGKEGESLCGEVGIIEPITYAMQRGFYNFPEEMLKICRYAVKEKDPFLSHRPHNAAYSVIGVNEVDSARAAHKALKTLKGVY